MCRNKDKALHDLFTTPKERVTPGPAYYNPKIPHYKIESRNKSKRWSV